MRRAGQVRGGGQPCAKRIQLRDAFALEGPLLLLILVAQSFAASLALGQSRFQLLGSMPLCFELGLL